jgi:hypothetical protein
MLLGAISFISLDQGHVDAEEVKQIIAGTVTYPYETDRALVMQHMADKERHESDQVKRTRIREEVGNRLLPLEAQLRREHTIMMDRLGAIEGRLDAMTEGR